jgi:hypothetical protein
MGGVQGQLASACAEVSTGPVGDSKAKYGQKPIYREERYMLS